MAEVHRSFIATTVREDSQVTPQGEPQVGFELQTNSFQCYAIANLDKTSLCRTLHPTRIEIDM